MALMLVLGSMLVLTLFASTALAYAIASQPLSRHDQDFNAALGAAQAGIDDYIRQLNVDGSYATTPTKYAAECPFNPALQGPACPTNASIGWQNVDSGSTDGAQFHYDVDASQLGSAGSIVLTSTGRMNGVSRTLQATIGSSSSTQYVYFTNYEDSDPNDVYAYPGGTAKQDPGCAPVVQSGPYKGHLNYWWSFEGVSPTPPGTRQTAAQSGVTSCNQASFTGGDVLNGPAHTNDTPNITSNGAGSPKFIGTAQSQYSLETADPNCVKATPTHYDDCWQQGNDPGASKTASPTFVYPPRQGAILNLPDSTANLATAPGCDYVGPTSIVFTSDGKMTVWSKDTSSATTSCGGGSVQTASGATVDVPSGGVIYVAAATASDPPLHRSACAPGSIDGTLPIADDLEMQNSDQNCAQGNVYVRGVLKGRVTVGAANSIMITGDLTYQGGKTGPDVLGLVATNEVEIMHPWIPVSSPFTCGNNDNVWVKTSGQWITPSAATIPGWTVGNGNAWGWQQGYFSGSGATLAWHPGSWVNNATTSPTGAASQFWKGDALSGAWSSSTTYGSGANVQGGDGNLYRSVQSSNKNHDPTQDSHQTWWTPTTMAQAMAGSWVSKGSNGASPQTGQVWQSGTASVSSDSGTVTLSAGKWASNSGQYYQGDNWTEYCDDSSRMSPPGVQYPVEATRGTINIYASIQTLLHTFTVPYWKQGNDQGTIYLFGSVAQNFRGHVGNGTAGTSAHTGYGKNYNYDPRLANAGARPPYFLSWANSVWSAQRVGEIRPQH